ncbi:MAG TPA: hypothetical protein PKB02_00710 [Anaerohalosphaeraceae bacterium]|nr:hypothetical protein [Anaerohalosphaeraceae bacterium]
MSTKFLNEPIWSRRACVELREPVRSRGIEPDCVRQNKANSAFLHPCILVSMAFTKRSQFPHFWQKNEGPSRKQSQFAGSWQPAARSFPAKQTHLSR